MEKTAEDQDRLEVDNILGATDIIKEEQMMEQMEQMMEQMMEAKQNHLETQQTLKVLRDGAGKLAGALASREDEGGRHRHAYA